jgi:hypothetical protein
LSPTPTVLGLPLSEVFEAYIGLLALLLAVVLRRGLPLGRALIGVAVLAAWLAYDFALGALGFLGTAHQGPPGIALLAGPPSALILLVLGVSPVGRALARGLPLALVIGLQTFRVGVELTLLSLAQAGLVPRVLTLGGGNVEILVGLTAPLAAWAATRGAAGRRIALVWNVIGLASLVNVSVRAALTAPGPLNLLHAEVPNLAMASVPFSYIPGFMAPLALLLHVLAFRALRGASAPQVSPARLRPVA